MVVWLYLLVQPTFDPGNVTPTPWEILTIMKFAGAKLIRKRVGSGIVSSLVWVARSVV